MSSKLVIYEELAGLNISGDFFRVFYWGDSQKKGFPGFWLWVRVSTAKSGRRSDASPLNTPLLKNGAGVKPKAPFTQPYK